ncbi:SLAM family member 9-like [Paramisgurnus dabryanus]|uniref:SLAM family member 9-like n=1 Tax=Paramisgurnus dabryanus TaxID=90735 RepID=UPI0031F42C4D
MNFGVTVNVFVCSGVFGDEVSVMEGDSLTLNADTEIKSQDVISWSFGHQGTIIAKINKAAKTTKTYTDDFGGRFRDRLQLNDQTGDLTITNITTQHTGLYQLTISGRPNALTNQFNVIVYAHLPIPVITTQNSSSSETSSCVFVCSVLNVREVSLSWYKGNSLLSTISVSDLNISSISLHLKCLDDSYSCVVNNPISNQTQHLNITHLCQTCSDLTLIIICCVAVGCLMIASVLIFWIYRKHKNKQQQVQNRGTEITYADPTFCKRAANKPGSEDDVVYAGVKRK